MKSIFLFLLFSLFGRGDKITSSKPLKDSVRITVDRAYSPVYPEDTINYIGYVYLEITVINRSDNVICVYMPQIPPPPPSERDGFDCFGVFQSDTLELCTAYCSLILEPNTLETRQYSYGFIKLDTLYKKYHYTSTREFIRDLVRESRYYFILNKRDTCKAEENPSLNVEFWENPDDMYWGVPGVLRKEKLPEVGLKSSLVSSE